MKKKYIFPRIQVIKLVEEAVRTSGFPLQSGVTFYDRNHFSNDRGFNGGNFVM